MGVCRGWIPCLGGGAPGKKVLIELTLREERRL
jgi:hypothetical protein